MTWRPEDFDDLAGHLRRQMGAEIREEAEEVERLTELHRRRKQTLSDVATRAMQSGFQATVSVAGSPWHGSISGVGSDYLMLQTDRAILEAPFSSLSLSLLKTRTGGQNKPVESRSWVARLSELAMEETYVTLVTESDRFEGRIRLVAVDHLEFEGGVYVMIENVKAVIRSLV